jgi:SAM-dependent methyltransferase
MDQYNHDKILKHWNDKKVESMYDKILLNAEIDMIQQRILAGSKVLDAGCGEGEGAEVYASIPGSEVHAVDFSDTRLEKASERLHSRNNVTLKKVDFIGNYHLDDDYDVVVSQRFLINITDWELQKKIILNLMGVLKKGGLLIMLEGFVQGVAELNMFRELMTLPPIPVPWHNLFIDEELLIPFMSERGFNLVDNDGLGSYFLLTRGVRPSLDTKLNWDCDFNKAAISKDVAGLLGVKSRFSRLKLWVFQK